MQLSLAYLECTGKPTLQSRRVSGSCGIDVASSSGARVLKLPSTRRSLPITPLRLRCHSIERRDGSEYVPTPTPVALNHMVTVVDGAVTENGIKACAGVDPTGQV
jgi:hypothetical protein